MWIINTETTKEKEQKNEILAVVPTVKSVYNYCLSFIPNIKDLDYQTYTNSINEKFLVEDYNYYNDENKYIVLNNYQIYKRCSFSIWYSKIQSIKIEMNTINDKYVHCCKITFLIFYFGSVYYEETDNCKWEDTCANISFDQNHLDDAKQFCRIIKTIMALQEKEKN